MKFQYWQSRYVPRMFSYFCSMYKTSLITRLTHHFAGHEFQITQDYVGLKGSVNFIVFQN